MLFPKFLLLLTQIQNRKVIHITEVCSVDLLDPTIDYGDVNPGIYPLLHHGRYSKTGILDV